MDTSAYVSPLPTFQLAPQDTSLALDLGELWSPQVPPAPFASRNSKQEPRFSLLGPPHTVAANVDTLPLDLETYRAFRSEDRIIDTWNKNVLQLMKRSDQEKRGELKIGVELPAAVQSILGEGGAGLKVSGYRRILFSGRSQWTDAANVSSVRQSKFPSLTMDQISRFTVEGTVGSKVSVKVDQDSKRQTDLANRIQIRYKGDEDDILKTVEAGNTTLSLPNTQFVGYSQSIQGLFGLKATAQVGPVDFTMITSQEKGNSVRNRFTAGANEQKIIIRDYQYAHNRFFDLLRVKGSDSLHWEPGDKVLEFELFEHTGAPNTSNELDRDGVAYADILDSTREDFRNYRVDGRFKRLVFQTDYLIDLDSFYVFFPTRRIQLDTRALAYYARVQRKSGEIIDIGDINGDSLLFLQLLKRGNPTPTDPLWDAEWKNVYDLSIRNIKYEDLDLDILRGSPGDEENVANLDHQNKVPYLELLGLDQADASGKLGTPDGKIDRNDAILDLDAGLLIFPDRRPFDPADGRGRSVRFPDSSLDPVIPAIYESNNSTDLRRASQYFIQIVTRSRSTSFSLRQINIMPESEVVTLNGRRLIRGSDYTLDYDIGQITFLTDDVLDPNANLTIDYEFSPFLSIEKKTLFGLRSEYSPDENLRTGMTFLYKGSKQTNRPAQLGQEPFRDMVLDYDVYWKTRPRLFTKLADALPLVKTESPSNLNIAAEVARSMPNPNTQGQVYIDDFESARQAYSLGILRETYSIASPPLDYTTLDPKRTRGFQDPALIWYNPYTQFRVTDIYDRNLQNQSDNRTHVLVLDFNPEKSILLDSVGGDPRKVWAGIMRGLPKGAWDQTRAEFIELRMAVQAESRDENDLGVLHIDLGRISEDVDGDGELDTEDRNRNGVLEPEEDVGLDLKPDSAEVTIVGTDTIPYDPVTNPDPAGDNWFFDNRRENEVTQINGTEGNSAELLAGRPDTEDLGGESEFDQVNGYYSFQIDLAHPDPKVFVEGSDRTRNGLTWKTYRIPVWDPEFYKAFGDVDSNNIQFVRLWLDGAGGRMVAYVAAIDMVESRWKGEMAPGEEFAPDTTELPIDLVHAPPDRNPWPAIPAGVQRTEPPSFVVAVKNTEVDATYETPPGINGYRDPTTGVREKEQALSLEYTDFIPGDTGRAVFSENTSQDFTGYRYLRLYIHGDDYADGRTEFFLRFGQDADTYYEYRDAVYPGWDVNSIDIDFNILTAFKEEARRVFVDRGETLLDTFNVDTHLGVHGLPSLSRVSYMEMGVIRTGRSSDPPHSAEIWCDELRLTDVRKDAGTAGRVSVTAQFADLMGLTATVDGQNYAFRNLTAGRTGSVVNSSSRLQTSVRGNISLNKFLPANFGLSLPISANYSRRVLTPKLLTGSDVVLSSTLQLAERTIEVVDGISTSIRWKPSTKNWLVQSTVGGLSGRVSVNRRRARSPTVPGDTSLGYSAGADYNLKFKKRLTFPALFWTKFLLLPKRIHQTQLSLLPTDFSASGTVTRNQSRRINSNGLVTDTYTRQFQGRSRLGLSPIPSVHVNYSMTTNRDLADPENIRLTLNSKQFKLGQELQFTQRVTGDYKPTLFSFLSPSFSYSSDFKDNIDYTYFDHDVTVNRRISINGTFNLARFWSFMALSDGQKGRGGRSRGRSRRTQEKKRSQPKNDGKDKGKKQDSTKTVASSGGGIGPLDVWRGMIGGFKKITSPIDAMSVSFSRQNSDQRRNLAERPPFKYQFGVDLFHDSTFALLGTAGNGSRATVDQFTTTDAFNVKNNFKFSRYLSIASNYSQSEATREQPGALPAITKSKSFPNLSTSLGQLEKFRPFRWIFTTASAKIAFSRRQDASFTGDSLNTRTTTEGFSPLISLTGNTRKGVRLSFNMDRTTTLSDAAFGNASKRTARSMRLTADYSFRSPNGLPLPFLRGLRLKSQLTMSVQITRKSSQTFTAPAGTRDFKPTQASSEFSISPRANYSFSSRVKGGLTAQWTDSRDNSRGAERKNHVRELGIWAEFSF